MIPATFAHMQASPFRTEIDVNDDDVMESTSTHPCHRLSIPAARLFWCRHCMQIFEDPITRWRHSKTCLHSSSGKVRKDKDGSTMQVFLSANSLSELRREQNRSRVISRSVGPGQSPGTDLRCFICKTAFVSIEEMRVHVRTPCRKRPTLAVPKQKYSAMPAEIKTQIQIPDTASEIIYIKDGHQTVISLESPCAAEVLNTEFVEPNQEYDPDNVPAMEKVIILPDTFDSTTNLNAIEQTVEITAVETVIPVASKSEEVPKQPKHRNENKENNIRKRKRVLPKEIDDWPNHKMSNSPKPDPQIALSLPTKPDDAKDISEDFETPPIKISKMTNKEPEDETGQAKVWTKPLHTKEELSQLLTTERKENQFFLEGEHLPNGVVTEQVSDEDVLLTAPASPVEKIVTGAAAEARLKDLFTTIEMQNKMKLSSSPKQAKSINSPPESPCKTNKQTNIRNDDTDRCPNDEVEEDENQSDISPKEEIDNSGLLLYMPPINAGSVTLPDPLLDLQSGLPAEMLLDETTNTKPPIPTAPEAINTFVPSDLLEETKLPSHIFDGDLLPSQIHSEVLFEEITDEKDNSSLVDSRIDEELVMAEPCLEEAVKIDSPVGIRVTEEETGEETEECLSDMEMVTVAEVDTPTLKDSEEIQDMPLEELELEQVNHVESVLPVSESLEMSNQVAETNHEETNNTEVKIKISTDEEEETIHADKSETETKHKLSKLFKCKACSNTFKTSQALQKHSRVPCKIKHTRSLSQKILRPKQQPCLKIEKKPIKKKMVKPTRRPKLMIPIIPITRSELIRPAVPRRPKRFSRRKRKKTYFIDEQNRILPFVNVLMSELSDKDRFFYKLGMINQCRKIPSSSETTTATAQNGEAPALETLGDSAEESLSKLQFPDIVTESTSCPPVIAPLSPAGWVAAEPHETSACSASPAVAGACVSDKENPSTQAKGLCLSLPTLEKMDNNQFHDPNCISPSSVKLESPDSSDEMTGQSVQSPCWEAAPRLAQLPGVTQIVRVTSSPDLSTGTGMTKKLSPESDLGSVIANSKETPLSNSGTLSSSKTQSKEISQEMVNDSSLNISGNLLLKCEEIEELDSKEPLVNLFQKSASQPEIVSVSLQRLSLKEQSCSASKVKIQKTDKKKKARAESKMQLKKGKIISLENARSSRSPICKNSIKSKLNRLQGAKYNIIKSINPTKNHDRIKDRNQKQTDSFTGANIAMRQKKHRSGDSSISNLQKGISSSVSQDITCLSSEKVTSEHNSAFFIFESLPDKPTSCEKTSMSLLSPMATTTLCKKVAANEESHITTSTLGQNVASRPESPTVTSSTLGQKSASNPISPMATSTLYKKVASNQATPTATSTLCQKVASRPESPTATSSTLGQKSASNPESSTSISASKNIASKQNSASFILEPLPDKSCEKVAMNLLPRMANSTLGQKPASNPESSTTTSTLCKNVASNQATPTATSTLCQKVAPRPESPMAISTLCKKLASNEESPMATTRPVSPTDTSILCKKVASNQESPTANTTLCQKVASRPESPMATNTLCKKVPSNQESHIATASLCQKVPSNQESRIAITSSHENLPPCVSTMPAFSSGNTMSKHSVTLSIKTEPNEETTIKENQNFVSIKTENGSTSSISNDQNRKSLIISPVCQKAVCNVGSDPVSNRHQLCQSKTVTHKMQEDQNRQPLTKEYEQEQQSAKDAVAQPIERPFPIGVSEETPKNLSGTSNDNQRHFSDIFGHEKVSLGGDDLNSNYPISPSKERTKRHFTDFLCLFSEDTSAPRTESTQEHSGSSVENIKSIKIEVENVSEDVKANETRSTRLEQEKKNVRIDDRNMFQVAGVFATSCQKYQNQELDNEKSVKMTESPVTLVLKDENVKDDVKPSPISGECNSESSVTELLSEESSLNSESCSPCKTEVTAVLAVTSTTVTTSALSYTSNNDTMTNSNPVDHKTPSPNSETPCNLSATTASNPRVSIATQTDTSFLKEIKTGASVPSDSCDNLEKKEPIPSSVSLNLDTRLLSSPPPTDTNPSPTPVDVIPSPTVEERSEEVVQEKCHLGTNPLPLSPEIVTNDNHLSTISASAEEEEETSCEPVQEGEVVVGVQEKTDDCVLLQQSDAPPPPVGVENVEQHLVLDNTTDPNVLVQYLNSLDPSILPEEVTFVIIQGTPGEALHLTDDHNFIIEQTGEDSAGGSVIYALQSPPSDIATEAEVVITDSS